MILIIVFQLILNLFSFGVSLWLSITNALYGFSVAYSNNSIKCSSDTTPETNSYILSINDFLFLLLYKHHISIFSLIIGLIDLIYCVVKITFVKWGRFLIIKFCNAEPLF